MGSYLHDSQSSMLSGGASVTQSTFFKSVDLGAESKLSDQMNFSQLMAEADDATEDCSSAFVEDPSLHDESSHGSGSDPLNLPQQIGNETFDERFRRVQRERLLSHAGQSHRVIGNHIGMNVSRHHGDMSYEDLSAVTAKRLGEETFTVQGFIRNDRQNLNDIITVGQAVQVVSNPDLLRIWCSSVSALFVTKESSSRSDQLRQYDAEWVEGVISIRHPGQGLYGAYSYFKSLLCWSSTCNGNIKMFIERARAQIAVTMGPVGGCEVTHTFSFRQSPTGVHVINTVKVDRMNVRLYCTPQKVKELLLPSIASHMEQAIESLEDLIRLVQIGPDAFIQSKHALATMGLYGDREDDSGSTPLLSSVV